jgi:type VI secretion system Hcp family effector
MKSIRYFSAVLSIVLFWTGYTASAQKEKVGVKMYLRVVGAKQGLFKASKLVNVVPGIIGEGFIEVKDVSFNEQTPTDAPHYKDKGVIQHQTLKVIKDADAVSPQFLMASMNNEALTSVILKFSRPNTEGVLVVFMTLTLSGASISDFSQNGGSETISIRYTEMKLEEPATK